jgi:hypothetical protein
VVRLHAQALLDVLSSKSALKPVQFLALHLKSSIDALMPTPLAP